MAGVGGKRKRVQAARDFFTNTRLVQLDELAKGEFGVQNPPAPAKSLGRFRSDRENRAKAQEKRRFREISPLFSRLTFFRFP